MYIFPWWHHPFRLLRDGLQTHARLHFIPLHVNYIASSPFGWLLHNKIYPTNIIRVDSGQIPLKVNRSKHVDKVSLTRKLFSSNAFAQEQLTCLLIYFHNLISQEIDGIWSATRINMKLEEVLMMLCNFVQLGKNLFQ